MQFLTKVDQLKAQFEAGMCWLRIKTLGKMCRTIDLHFFKSFKFQFEEKKKTLEPKVGKKVVGRLCGRYLI